MMKSRLNVDSLHAFFGERHLENLIVFDTIGFWGVLEQITR